MGGLRDEGGYTLIELLVTMLIATVVLGAILTTLDVSQRIEARDTERDLAMQEARVGLSRMTREIRQASEIKKAEVGAIEFLTTVGGTAWQVKYTCEVSQVGTTYHMCVRVAAESGKTLSTPSTENECVHSLTKSYTGASIICNVLNPTEVFKYFEGASEAKEPSKELEKITSVTLKVRMPLQGSLKQVDSSGYKGDNILENAAFLRNRDLAG